MNLVDSHQRQLNYGELLHLYHQNTYADDPKLGDFRVWLVGMATAIDKMKSEETIIGNTLFIYKRGEGEKSHAAMVWALNADTPANMTANIMAFIKHMHKDGVTTFVSTFDSQATARIVRQAFSKLKQPGDTIDMKKTPQGGIVLTMTFKERRDV